jgi:hypothetical protein
LLKSVKTCLASVFSDMDRRIILMMTTDRTDQYTASLVRYAWLYQGCNSQAQSFQRPKILFPQILPTVPKERMATKNRYVFQAVAS